MHPSDVQTCTVENKTSRLDIPISGPNFAQNGLLEK